MKKMIVPIDFTLCSRNASEYAVQLAAAMEAEVHLLHVYAEPMPAGNVPDTSMIMADIRTEYEVRIKKETELLKDKYGVAVKGDAVPGFKSDTINEVAGELHTDLIVMGLKTARKNRILGSTTLKMIRKSPRPVLLVPEGARFSPLKNMVLAIDFNEMISSAGMEAFVELAQRFDCSVSVLHVQKKGGEMKASEVSEKVQMGLVLSKLTYTYEQVEADEVDEGILAFINHHPTDLLVMIAHHHSVLERLFSSVHTRAISFETKLPLLVLKMKPLFE